MSSAEHVLGQKSRFVGGVEAKGKSFGLNEVPSRMITLVKLLAIGFLLTGEHLVGEIRYCRPASESGSVACSPAPRQIDQAIKNIALGIFNPDPRIGRPTFEDLLRELTPDAITRVSDINLK